MSSSLPPFLLDFDPAHSGLARRLMQDLSATPNRLLGQNFLVNPAALDRIVETAQVTEADSVLEIGPGLGALTVRLMRRAQQVAAIEKDVKLASFLDGRVGAYGLHLVTADALEVPWSALELPETGVKVVANLPYSVSKPLLRRILEEWRPHLRSATLLVQREVANRLIAAPATSDYGPLSLMAQLYGRTRKAFDIAPGSFFPPPAVTSTVVHIEILEQPSLALYDERAFWRTVRAAFGQRRKTLGNTLKTLAPREVLAETFSTTAIDPQRRGETLSLAEFARLSELLARATPSAATDKVKADRAPTSSYATPDDEL